jgi:hypothetical protein
MEGNAVVAAELAHLRLRPAVAAPCRFARKAAILTVAIERYANVSYWPDSAVVGIRSGGQLSEDKLPYTAIVHDDRI